MKTKRKATKSAATKQPVTPEFARTQRELAAILGVSRETIARRVLAPASPGKKSAGYQVAAWRQFVTATARTTRQDSTIEQAKLDQVSAKRQILCRELAQLMGAEFINDVWAILKPTLGGPTEIVRERRAIEWLKARKLEVERDVRSGKLKPEEEVSRVVGEVFQDFVQALKDMGHKIGYEVVGIDADEAHRRIHQEVVGAFERFQLAHWAKEKPYWGTIKARLEEALHQHFPETAQ